MRLKDRCRPVSFPEFEDRDVTIGGGAGEQAAEFVR